MIYRLLLGGTFTLILVFLCAFLVRVDMLGRLVRDSDGQARPLLRLVVETL